MTELAPRDDAASGRVQDLPGRPAPTSIPALGYQPGLDGLRGIAVALVVLFHARILWFGNGGIGVEVFFVLSGFLITSLLIEEFSRRGSLSFRGFYVRRAARLLPAYLAVVVVALAVESLFLDQGGTRRGALVSFFYAANWAGIVDPGAGQGMLAHTWTLSIEEQFYLLWPVLLLVLCRHTRSLTRLAWAIGALIALLVVEVGLLVAFDPHPEVRVHNGTDTRAPILLSGALLAVLLARRRVRAEVLRSRPWLQVAACVALVALVATSFVVDDDYGRIVVTQWPVVVLASAVLIVGAVATNGPVRAALAWAPLVGLGRISYGLYLWHFPVFFVVDVRAGLGTFSTVALAISVSLALALASYRWLEVPLRRRAVARWAEPRDVAVAPVVQAGPAVLTAPAVAASGERPAS